MESMNQEPAINKPTKRDRSNRYALEWFVREKDEWYWKRTQSLVDESRKEAAALMKRAVAASTIAIIISGFSLLRK